MVNEARSSFLNRLNILYRIARLYLQTFFSEHGGGGGGGSEEGSEMMEELPELTAEELLARESLLTYFSDLIRRSGPMKVNGPEIRTHLEDRMTDGESLLCGKAVVDIEQVVAPSRGDLDKN